MRSPQDAFSQCLFNLLEAWHVEGYDARPPALYVIVGTHDAPDICPLPFVDPQLTAGCTDVVTLCEKARLAAVAWNSLPPNYPSPRWPGPLYAVAGMQVSWGLPGTGALVKEINARTGRPSAQRVPIHDRPDRVRAHFLIAHTVTGGLGSGYQAQDAEPDVFTVLPGMSTSADTSPAYQALVRLSAETQMAYRRFGAVPQEAAGE